MWVTVLQSGIHATLAGVVLALFIPMFDRTDPEHSPLEELEHDLHYDCGFWILPLFAFANSGISLEGAGLQNYSLSPALVSPLVCLSENKWASWLCVGWSLSLVFNHAKGMNYKQIYGAAYYTVLVLPWAVLGGLAFAGETLVWRTALGIIMGFNRLWCGRLPHAQSEPKDNVRARPQSILTRSHLRISHLKAIWLNKWLIVL